MIYLNRIHISNFRKWFFLALFFITGSKLCVAQQADSITPALKISSFGFNLGAVILTEQPGVEANVWLREFNSMAPNNPNLNKNIDTSGHKMSYGQTGFHFNCFINFKSPKAKSNFAKRSEHRLGLYYTGIPKYQLGFYKSDSLSVDTFYSNSSGYFNIDSVPKGHGYYYSLKGRSIGAEFSEIVYPLKWRILKPYTGLNIGLGVLFRQLTVAYNPEGEAYWMNRHGGGMIPENDINIQTTKLKPDFMGYTSIPLGLSLNRKIKPTIISAFIEARLGVSYIKYATTNYQFTPAVYIQAGIKLIRN